MSTIRDHILIHAPIERCFLLSTHLEIVRQTLGLQIVAVEGHRHEGFVIANDKVLWRGWKFGFPQRHLSLISGYEAPTHFQDSMLRGRFATFVHDHYFREVGAGTLLEDEVRFTLPFGPAGWLVSRTIVEPHVHTLLHRRFALLKRIAESDEWTRYIPVN